MNMWLFTSSRVFGPPRPRARYDGENCEKRPTECVDLRHACNPQCFLWRGRDAELFAVRCSSSRTALGRIPLSSDSQLRGSWAPRSAALTDGSRLERET